MEMQKLLIILCALLWSFQVQANHKIQHGFVLSEDGNYATHLVATGHHSWQMTLAEELSVPPSQKHRLATKLAAKGQYLLLQAQDLDLNNVEAGTVLTGHIVQADYGDYLPQNKQFPVATFTVTKVIVNLPNPFFKG